MVSLAYTWYECDKTTQPRVSVRDSLFCLLCCIVLHFYLDVIWFANITLVNQIANFKTCPVGSMLMLKAEGLRGECLIVGGKEPVQVHDSEYQFEIIEMEKEDF